MTTDIDVYEHTPPTLWGTDDPAAVVACATRAAQPLAEVVEKQRLFASISGRKHVRVEGWTLLGSMLGVFPVTVWSRKTEDGQGWEARVEARTRDGAVVGAAEAQCDRSERTWATRDEFALRSMAQTRATSKALRQPLGFVMTLAGFDATPFEEMPRVAAPEVIEDGEVVVDPAGNVFPDQRDAAASQFQPPSTANRDQPTDAQRKMLYRLVKKIGEQDSAFTEDTFRGELTAAYGVDSVNGLTKAEASQVITLLKQRSGEETG